MYSVWYYAGSYGTEGVSRDGKILTTNGLDSQEYVIMTPWGQRPHGYRTVSECMTMVKGCKRMLGAIGCRQHTIQCRQDVNVKALERHLQLSLMEDMSSMHDLMCTGRRVRTCKRLAEAAKM
jgi:hypothetical protein